MSNAKLETKQFTEALEKSQQLIETFNSDFLKILPKLGITANTTDIGELPTTFTEVQSKQLKKFFAKYPDSILELAKQTAVITGFVDGLFAKQEILDKLPTEIRDKTDNSTYQVGEKLSATIMRAYGSLSKKETYKIHTTNGDEHTYSIVGGKVSYTSCVNKAAGKNQVFTQIYDTTDQMRLANNIDQTAPAKLHQIGIERGHGAAASAITQLFESLTEREKGLPRFVLLNNIIDYTASLQNMIIRLMETKTQLNLYSLADEEHKEVMAGKIYANLSMFGITISTIQSHLTACIDCAQDISLQQEILDTKDKLSQLVDRKEKLEKAIAGFDKQREQKLTSLLQTNGSTYKYNFFEDPTKKQIIDDMKALDKLQYEFAAQLEKVTAQIESKLPGLGSMKK